MYIVPVYIIKSMNHNSLSCLSQGQFRDLWFTNLSCTLYTCNDLNNSTHIPDLEGRSGRRRGILRGQDGLQGALYLHRLVLAQRHAIKVGKEVVEELGSLLIAQPVLLVRRQH